MLSQHAPLAARFLCHLPCGKTADIHQSADEAQLLAAARRGDAEAYAWLVRKYHDRLYCSLSYMCGPIDDAQEVAQEAFLRAYLKLDSFTGASAFYAWLYRIAMNVVIAEGRRQTLCSLEDSAESSNGQEHSREWLLSDQRIPRVQQALQALSAEHRAILVLRELDDFNYDEIAGILCISVGTVRSRLHQARLELHALLYCINDQ